MVLFVVAGQNPMMHGHHVVYFAASVPVFLSLRSIVGISDREQVFGKVKPMAVRHCDRYDRIPVTRSRSRMTTNCTGGYDDPIDCHYLHR